MYIKLSVTTATLILLAAFTSKSHAGVEGAINTETADIVFRLEQGISVTPIPESGGKLPEGGLESSQKIATMTFQLARDVSYLAVRWVDARISPTDNQVATLVGLNPANVLQLRYSKLSGVFRDDASGDYSIYSTNGHPTQDIEIRSASQQNVSADVYTIKIEGTAWEL